MGLRAVLLLVAVVAFVLAAFKVSLGDVNLLYVGLAAFAGSFIVSETLTARR